MYDQSLMVAIAYGDPKIISFYIQKTSTRKVIYPFCKLLSVF